MAVTMAAIAVTLVAGCARQQSTEAGMAAGAGAIGADAGEKTALRFLAMEYDTNTRPFMDKIEREFEAANPDVDLSVEVIDWQAGFQKLSTLISAENAPDLANIATI